jgi:hypothetical protein
MSVRRRRWRVLAAAVLATLVSSAGSASAAFAASAVPYNDPGATGTITLCNGALQPITSGSVNDLPFVRRAVGSQAAPAPYNDGTGAAILYAFLPRKGVAPDLWNGEVLTGSTIYRDPAHPMADATPADWMLRYYTDDFVPKWDGFVQLRLYYQHQSAPQSSAYAAADIQVQGDTWTLVRGGTDDCGTTASAKSVELTLPDYHKYVRKAQADYVTYFKRHNLPLPTPTASPSTTARPGSNGNPAPDVTVTQSGSPVASAQSAGGFNAVPLVGVLLVALAGVAGWFAYRSTRR